VLAGRGFGKTRVGAETVRQWIKKFKYVNLIAPTSDDARDVMVEGESGILAICPKDERPYYRTSKSRLEWPNGARSLILTADEPDRIRGKQHEKIWADEVCAWRYIDEAWDQAMMGLRLGKNPQAVITTTPRPLKLIKELMKGAEDGTTVVTRGSTYDNKTNLSDKFFSKVITKYEGTRLGRQELNAEILNDNPRALFKLGLIDAARVQVVPNLTRVVVGLDPNVKDRDRAILAKSSDTLDEAGIVTCGSAYWPNGVLHFYVLGDDTIDGGPSEWGSKAVIAYKKHQADRLIGEVNNGGDMVESTVRAIDQNISYKAVTATRGKAIRAEPISALYEQGRVHHVGSFQALESEMTDFDPITTTKSPNRMDALVWALTELSGDDSTGMLEYMRQQVAGSQAGMAPKYTEPTTIEGWNGQPV
jgi:phage terminase large subunit-like protein